MTILTSYSITWTSPTTRTYLLSHSLWHQLVCNQNCTNCSSHKLISFTEDIAVFLHSRWLHTVRHCWRGWSWQRRVGQPIQDSADNERCVWCVLQGPEPALESNPLHVQQETTSIVPPHSPSLQHPLMFDILSNFAEHCAAKRLGYEWTNKGLASMRLCEWHKTDWRKKQ